MTPAECREVVRLMFTELYPNCNVIYSYQSIADWTEANEKLCICETTGISASPVCAGAKAIGLFK